jgi:hypothetical protein
MEDQLTRRPNSQDVLAGAVKSMRSEATLRLPSLFSVTKLNYTLTRPQTNSHLGGYCCCPVILMVLAALL